MNDLSDENAARLRDALAPYVAAARRVGRGRGRAAATPSPARQRRNLAEARGWLRNNGYPVKDRGRIPDEWLHHFDTKTPQPPTVTAADPRNDQPPHDVACQRDGTTALPRPRDHLGVDVMVIGSPLRVNQDTPVASGWRVWPGRCRRR
jgi:hypothetical protein